MILTVTPNPTIDEWAEVDQVVPVHKLRMKVVAFAPGGGGVNISRVLRQLGADAHAVVTAGGRTGLQLGDLLEAARIPTTIVEIAEETRQAQMILDRSTGEEYRFIPDGPTVSEGEWRRLIEVVAGQRVAPEFVVLGGSLPPGMPAEFVQQLASAAHGVGARFVADTSGHALHVAVEAGADIIKPSRRELAELAGVEQEHLDLEAAARVVVRRGVGVVVVSLGEEGAHLFTPELSVRIPSPVVEVQSTVGAGDAMLAGMLASLASGEGVLDAARHGVASGAATCMTPASEVCRPDDVDRLRAAALS